MALTPELLRAVVAATRSALSPAVGADWTVGAPGLEWSCRATGVHLADSWFAHAARLVARPADDFVAAEVSVPDTVEPARLLEAIVACGELLCCAATVADPAAVVWHPWGASDTAGTVAMGMVEGLVHTHDIAGGLGLDWRPPADLCRPALERLFPDAPTGDPADVLLWCTGRTALPGHARRATWRWYSSVRS